MFKSRGAQVRNHLTTALAKIRSCLLFSLLTLENAVISARRNHDPAATGHNELHELHAWTKYL